MNFTAWIWILSTVIGASIIAGLITRKHREDRREHHEEKATREAQEAQLTQFFELDESGITIEVRTVGSLRDPLVAATESIAELREGFKAPSTNPSADAKARIDAILNSQLKEDRRLRAALNSDIRRHILTTLLQIGGPATSREIYPVPLHRTTFNRHTKHLRNAGLLIAAGRNSGMTYEVHPAFVSDLFALLLNDDQV